MRANPTRAATRYATSFSLWEREIGGVPLVSLIPLAGGLGQEILIIYGGTTQEDFRWVVKRQWGEVLVSQGFAVHCFDFRSNVSGNNFYHFGLWDRLVDAMGVVGWLIRRPLGAPLSLVGVSMGGHIAAEIAGKLGERLANLVLVTPAAYHDKAIRPGLKFSPPGTGDDYRNPAGRFTRILRGYTNDGNVRGRYFSEAWRESSVFSVARLIKARVLIIRYNQDEVVKSVPYKYYESFAHGGLTPSLTVIAGNHSGSFTDPRKTELILKRISKFVADVN